MPTSPVIRAIFFCFSAMVLLLFVSIGVPTWSHVSFLTVGRGHKLKYGIFGSMGHGLSVGYYFSNSHLNSTTIHNLTKTLILHALAAGMAGFAFFFGLLFYIFGFHVCTIIMTLLAGFGMITTLIAWVINMILFGIARQRYLNDSDVAQYGNANWLTLSALITLTLGFCTSTCSIFSPSIAWNALLLVQSIFLFTRTPFIVAKDLLFHLYHEPINSLARQSS